MVVGREGVNVRRGGRGCRDVDFPCYYSLSPRIFLTMVPLSFFASSLSKQSLCLPSVPPGSSLCRRGMAAERREGGNKGCGVSSGREERVCTAPRD